MIYYRHIKKKVFDDSFEVVLSDIHDPPNLSEYQVSNNSSILISRALIKPKIYERAQFTI